MNKNPILANEKERQNFSFILNRVKGYNKFLPVIDEKKIIKYVIVQDEPSNTKNTCINNGWRLWEKIR